MNQEVSYVEQSDQKWEDANRQVESFKYNPKIRDWFKQNYWRVGINMDYRLIKRCWSIHWQMHQKDEDHFVLVVGGEGLGKSTVAAHICSWVDPAFNEDNFMYDIAAYAQAVKDKEKEAFIIDEGGDVLFSRDAMGRNKNIIRLFMKQRQRNDLTVICCPDYYSVDSYLRKHRINTLIRITSKGMYMGYVEEGIKHLNKAIIKTGKKPLSSIVIPDGFFWHGHWNKDKPRCVDESRYRILKKDDFTDFVDREFDSGKGKKEST